MADQPDDAVTLRARAGVLRVLAGRIGRSVMHDAARLGGDDVWRGPTADEYRMAATAAAAHLADATEGLRRAARLLEETALELGHEP